MAQGDEDIYRGQMRQRTPLNVALCLIWYRLWQLTGFNNGSGSGGIVIANNPVNIVPNNVAASTAIVIPAGAKGWTVTCLTGTLSIARGTTASLLPAGFSDSDPNTVASAITVTTASASTAYVRWNT